MRDGEEELGFEFSAIVFEYIELNRRRWMSGRCALDPEDMQRWRELRILLEAAMGSRVEHIRRSLRVPVAARAFVRVEPVGLEGRLHEISEGGVFIETSEPVEKGTFVRVVISDGEGRFIDPTGLVAWTRRELDGSGPPGMGIEFHVLEPREADRLIALVERTLLERFGLTRLEQEDS